MSKKLNIRMDHIREVWAREINQELSAGCNSDIIWELEKTYRNFRSYPTNSFLRFVSRNVSLLGM